MDKAALENLSRLIRYYILVQTQAAQSGHTTSSLSAVELATVLFFNHLRYDLERPANPVNDRFILSKGHASPLFYALYGAAGKLTEKELKKYRSLESTLEGHPSLRFPYTEALTGSLGQGLSFGVGTALALRMQYKNPPMVYTLLGDGEMAEGQVWEAIQYAAFRKVHNLVGIIDVNRLSQSEQTMLGHEVYSYEERVASFGWRTYVVENGHDVVEIDATLEKAVRESRRDGPPAMIIAKTTKGKGVSFWEDKNGWHSKVVPKDDFEVALKDLGDVDKTLRGEVAKPEEQEQLSVVASFTAAPMMTYAADEKVATKQAFGNAIERLGSASPQLVVLDGDMKNSTHTDQFEKKYPDRFFQVYIAEQNLVSIAWGMSRRGLKPLVCTFACFLTRAHDQFRLAALSNVNMLVCGAYAGVSLGKDGPSQMALEDMGMIRPYLGSTVLYPSDAYMTEKLVEEMLKREGLVYIKTTREPTPVIYNAQDTFPIGGSKTLLASENDEVTVVAAGITVFESLKAAKMLKEHGITVRVVDAYSIKPIDTETLVKAAAETKAIVTVEDHYVVGGLGDAVLEALAEELHPPIYKMGVTKTPRSGSPEELLKFVEIDAESIVKKVKSLL